MQKTSARPARIAFRFLEGALALVFLGVVTHHVLAQDFKPLAALCLPILVVFSGFASLLFVRGRSLADGPWQLRSLYAAERAMQATIWYLLGIILGTALYGLMKYFDVAFDARDPWIVAPWLVVVLDMEQAGAAPEQCQSGGARRQIAPSRRVQIEFAIAVAEGDMVGGAPAGIAQMLAGRVGAPVHHRIDLGDDDPGVDAVGAQEDVDAAVGLAPVEVGGDRAEQQGGEQRTDPQHRGRERRQLRVIRLSAQREQGDDNGEEQRRHQERRLVARRDAQLA